VAPRRLSFPQRVLLRGRLDNRRDHGMSTPHRPRLTAKSTAASRKIDLPLSISEWRPAPLVGQVVLVTTRNKDGTSNIAPKCWASMVASAPLTLAFNCNRDHWTARNVLRSREFVVNVPGAELASRVWAIAGLPHPRPVEAAGFTPLASSKVKPPRVAECRTHLECVLDRHLSFGMEVLLIGRIVAASADKTVAEARDPFDLYRTFVYLEPGTYGIIGRAHRARELRRKRG
jgi:flavin reductase (DIM6/NTAB) family NADH-FMN oxidoreductase RutF